MRAAINIALFFLPFLLYFVFLHLKERNPFLKEHWERRPVIWLGLAGIVLGVGGLAHSYLRQELDPSAAYVPARVVNGVLVPSHFERPPATRPQ